MMMVLDFPLRDFDYDADETVEDSSLFRGVRGDNSE